MMTTTQVFFVTGVRFPSGFTNSPRSSRIWYINHGHSKAVWWQKGDAWYRHLRQNYHHLRNTGLLLMNVCVGPIEHQARPSEIPWSRLPECGCKWPSTRSARAKLEIRA